MYRMLFVVLFITFSLFARPPLAVSASTEESEAYPEYLLATWNDQVIQEKHEQFPPDGQFTSCGNSLLLYENKEQLGTKPLILLGLAGKEGALDKIVMLNNRQVFIRVAALPRKPYVVMIPVEHKGEILPTYFLYLDPNDYQAVRQCILIRTGGKKVQA